MGDRVFLTEAREQVLQGTYDGSDGALRNQKSRLRHSARVALTELQKVAASPEIDNEQVFDPEEIRNLLVYLFAGPSGLITEDNDPEPATDYQNKMYVATERAQLHIERAREPSEIYELYGEKAQALREFNDDGE